jgi:hypothetical protein
MFEKKHYEVRDTGSKMSRQRTIRPKAFFLFSHPILQTLPKTEVYLPDAHSASLE